VIAPDQNQKTEFLNEARGHMITTSTCGSITAVVLAIAKASPHRSDLIEQ